MAISIQRVIKWLIKCSTYQIVFIRLWMLLMLMSSFNHLLANNALLSITPDSTTAVLQHEFEIQVKVSNVQNLFAVAFDVAYDTNLMTFHSITEGSFLNENGQAQTFFLYSVQAGKVIFAISRTNTNEPGVSSVNDTALATLRFTAVHHGSGEINLENTGLMEPDLSNIAHEPQNSSIRVIAPPKILNIPNVNLTPGDTLQLHLNEYIEDPDSPVEQLFWEVMEANHLDYTIDNELNILKFWMQSNTEQTRIKLKVSDPDGLSDTTSFNVVMPAGVGDNISVQPLFKVYPNPFRDKVTIESSLIDGSLQTIKIKITNAIGVEILKNWHLEEYNGNTQLGVSELLPGLYIFSIQLNEISYSIPIIKTNH